MAEQVDTGLHWSSTFQRLRTEAIILSLVLLVATQLELNLSKIPLIGIEFSGRVSRGTVTAFLFAFFIYTVTAWVVRYWRERASFVADNNKMLHLANVVSDAIEKAVGLSSPTAKQFSLRLEEATRLIEQTQAEFGATSMVAMKERLDVLAELYKDFRAQMDLAAKSGRVDARGVFQDRAVHFSDRYNDVTVASQRIAELTGTLETLASELRHTKQEITKELDDREPKVAATISEVREVMGQMRKHLNSLKSSIRWDLEILGFWIPIATAVLLVGYATPQGLADISAALDRHLSCLAQQGMSCIYRSKGFVSADELIIELPPELTMSR